MEAQIELVHDKALKKAAGSDFGKYLGTYFSERRQIRADLFERGGQVTAYISYPTGLNPTIIEDRYVSDLDEYAARHGFADRFRYVYAQY